MGVRLVKDFACCWMLSVVVSALSPVWASAQTPEASPISLPGAVQAALNNYPAIKESQARAQAAEETIGVARAAYLPRLDGLWQANRATANNVFGLLLPQSIVPPVSGPVLATQSYDGVWGSTAGVLLSWQAVDFGVRRANVEVARAQATSASAQSALTQLDIAAAAADAFLTVLAADEMVKAARANVDRLQVFADSVRTLVQNQLRPGADQSRSEAELAIARNQLSQATESAEIARATLAGAMGLAGTTVMIDAGRLSNSPVSPGLTSANLQSHPATRVQTAVIDAVRARERALDRTYLPHIDFQSAFAARGSGAQVLGLPVLSNAFTLPVRNWAVGVSIMFPAFEVFTSQARKSVEVQNEAAERARYEQVLQNLTTQSARAQALMRAAIEIARNTPVERQAATDAETRAKARYSSGLANITEVADAERLLAQAEADEAVARLGVWRALLAQAQAGGDLTPFLDELRTP